MKPRLIQLISAPGDAAGLAEQTLYAVYSDGTAYYWDTTWKRLEDPSAQAFRISRLNFLQPLPAPVFAHEPHRIAAE